MTGSSPLLSSFGLSFVDLLNFLLGNFLLSLEDAVCTDFPSALESSDSGNYVEFGKKNQYRHGGRYSGRRAK